MLEEKHVDKHIRKVYYNEKYAPKISTVYVSIGIKKEFNVSYKPYVFLPVHNNLRIDKNELKNIGVTIHNFDPTCAPKGKTVLTLMLESKDPKYWIDLRKDNPEEYTKRKKSIAEHVIEELSHHFGSVKKNIEMVDVATPATYVRYTNNWNGAPMGWQDFMLFVNKPKKEIKGLANFYMCGQWVGDGGLPMAARSGRDVAQIICKKDDIVFKTSQF
jgi:phytoene dehydrogenase-like protein